MQTSATEHVTVRYGQADRDHLFQHSLTQVERAWSQVQPGYGAGGPS